MTDFSLWMPFAKVDATRRTVAGYATTPDRDMDGEIITLDAVKAALPDYMAWGNIREMHTNRAVGVADPARTQMDTTGLWLTAKIVDDDAWKKCVEGVYKGFSIGGRKEAVAEKDPSTITAIKLVEISIVDRPANPSCRFDVRKRAKPGAPAHLIRLSPPRSPAQRALKKMAQAVEVLAKTGPPAAHDGFSLPAKPVEKDGDGHKHDIVCETGPPIDKAGPCKAHGVADCPECMDKREFSEGERSRLASTGAALPDAKDLSNAHQAIGRAKDPARAKAHIKARARALGLPNPFKGKKSARKLAKRHARAAARIRKTLARVGDLSPLFPPPLSAPLPLPVPEADGRVGSGHELDLKGGERMSPPFLTLRKRKVKKSSEVGDRSESNSLEDQMNTEVKADAAPTLEATLEKIIRKARGPSRAQMMVRAGRDLKKARKAAKDMEGCVKSLHAMHKAAYIAKQAAAALAKAKKPKPDDGDADDDSFDHQGAMEKLQKAYSDLATLKTMLKSARTNLEKVSNGGRGPTDGNEFFTVPPGVKDTTNDAMARTGPGAGSGSEPPIQALDVEWKGAGIDRITNAIRKGYVSAEQAALMVENAKLAGKVEALEKLPAVGGGRRPVLFDAKALTGPNGRGAALMDGVDQAGLYSDDESARKSAVGTLIGNMVFNGMGKSVLDPNFRGRGGV